MEAKIYAIINQKGGVGKSTTAEALTSGLVKRGFKVLAIDTDTQGNLSYVMRATTQSGTTLDLLQGKATAADVIQHTATADIIAASKGLANADVLITETGKEYRLKEALQPMKRKYDYIVIDTPPKIGILTTNALTASDYVIIPAQADVFSLQGIVELSEQIGTVRKYCNPHLLIKGILLTRFNARTVLSREVAEQAAAMAKNLNARLFKATIRESIAIKEAQAQRESLFTYAPASKAAADYNAFITELLN